MSSPHVPPDRPTPLPAGADWDEPTRVSPAGPSGETSAAPRPSELLTGTRVGDYVFGGLLGAGGMGDVYAGEQPVIGKKVAIKVLKLEIAAEPEHVNRMLAEARAVNAIRHRGIVDIFNFGALPDGRPYLVMEYLTGEPLDALLATRGAFSPIEACELLEEASAALWAAHSAGVVHRDLKPANTFVVTDPTSAARYVKLLDFGLAKSTAANTKAQGLTQIGMVVGTPDYMAPEQARGEAVTGQTDLYSLGVMAFELLTGEVPFTAPSPIALLMEHLQTEAPRVSSRRSGVPPELDELVWSMMAKTPGERPESADAVRRELKKIRLALRDGETRFGVAPRAGKPKSVPQPPEGTGSSTTLPSAGSPERSTEKALHAAGLGASTRPAWLWPVIGAGALGLAALGAFGLPRKPPPEPQAPAPPGAPSASPPPFRLSSSKPAEHLGPNSAPFDSAQGEGRLDSREHRPELAPTAAATPAENPGSGSNAGSPETPGLAAAPVQNANPAASPKPAPAAEPLREMAPSPGAPRAPAAAVPGRDLAGTHPTEKSASPPPAAKATTRPSEPREAVAPNKARGPTREALLSGYARALKRLRTDLSPQLVDGLSKRLKQEIDAAETAEQREQAQRSLRDFEARYVVP